MSGGAAVAANTGHSSIGIAAGYPNVGGGYQQIVMSNFYNLPNGMRMSPEPVNSLGSVCYIGSWQSVVAY